LAAERSDRTESAAPSLAIADERDCGGAQLMNSVLFVAVIDPNAQRRNDWIEFGRRVAEKITPGPDALRLAENVWLLNLEKSVAGLGWLISAAEDQALSYGILPFERKPVWLPAGFYPDTNRDQTASS
jgi:hypothetical protein